MVDLASKIEPDDEATREALSKLSAEYVSQIADRFTHYAPTNEGEWLGNTIAEFLDVAWLTPEKEVVTVADVRRARHKRCVACQSTGHLAWMGCGAANDFTKKNGLDDKKHRPGDWCCSACNKHNFARRRQCHGCNATRSAECITYGKDVVKGGASVGSASGSDGGSDDNGSQSSSGAPASTGERRRSASSNGSKDAKEEKKKKKKKRPSSNGGARRPTWDIQTLPPAARRILEDLEEDGFLGPESLDLKVVDSLSQLTDPGMESVAKGLHDVLRDKDRRSEIRNLSNWVQGGINHIRRRDDERGAGPSRPTNGGRSPQQRGPSSNGERYNSRAPDNRGQVRRGPAPLTPREVDEALATMPDRARRALLAMERDGRLRIDLDFGLRTLHRLGDIAPERAVRLCDELFDGTPRDIRDPGEWLAARLLESLPPIISVKKQAASPAAATPASSRGRRRSRSGSSNRRKRRRDESGSSSGSSGSSGSSRSGSASSREEDPAKKKNSGNKKKTKKIKSPVPADVVKEKEPSKGFADYFDVPAPIFTKPVVPAPESPAVVSKPLVPTSYQPRAAFEELTSHTQAQEQAEEQEEGEQTMMQVEEETPAAPAAEEAPEEEQEDEEEPPAPPPVETAPAAQEQYYEAASPPAPAFVAPPPAPEEPKRMTAASAAAAYSFPAAAAVVAPSSAAAAYSIPVVAPSPAAAAYSPPVVAPPSHTPAAAAAAYSTPAAAAYSPPVVAPPPHTPAAAAAAYSPPVVAPPSHTPAAAAAAYSPPVVAPPSHTPVAAAPVVSTPQPDDDDPDFCAVVERLPLRVLQIFVCLARSSRVDFATLQITALGALARLPEEHSTQIANRLKIVATQADSTTFDASAWLSGTIEEFSKVMWKTPLGRLVTRADLERSADEVCATCGQSGHFEWMGCAFAAAFMMIERSKQM